jgi:pilus assembly protein CpaF
VPPRVARTQIASAIGVVVQANRLIDGRRKVTSITEITGMEGGKFQMQELFRFVNLGYVTTPDGNKVRGYFSGCDMVPSFYESLRAVGNALDMSIFKPGAPS